MPRIASQVSAGRNSKPPCQITLEIPSAFRRLSKRTGVSVTALIGITLAGVAESITEDKTYASDTAEQAALFAAGTHNLCASRAGKRKGAR